MSDKTVAWIIAILAMLGFAIVCAALIKKWRVFGFVGLSLIPLSALWFLKLPANYLRDFLKTVKDWQAMLWIGLPVILIVAIALSIQGRISSRSSGLPPRT